MVEKPGEAGTVTNCTVSKGAELGLAAGDRADGAAGAQVNMTYNFSATQKNGRIVSAVDGVTGENVSHTYDSLNRLIAAATTNRTGPI